MVIGLTNLLFFLAETVEEPDEPNNEYCDDGQGEYIYWIKVKEVIFRNSDLFSKLAQNSHL